jgi:hypothetical protein
MDFLDYDNWLLNEEQMRGISDWTNEDMAEWGKLHVENLGKLGEIFAKTRTPWWIDAGTLLGIHRDKRIIKGDSDSDVGMKVENLDRDFLETVKPFWHPAESSMFYGFDEIVDKLEDDKYHPGKSIKFCGLRNKRGGIRTFKGKQIWTDVFIYFPWKKDRIYKFADGYFRTKDELLQNFDRFTHYGVSLKRPSDVEKYLELTYGKSWKTPDPQYKSKETDVYGGPIDVGGTYKWNFKQKDFKIE